MSWLSSALGQDGGGSGGLFTAVGTGVGAYFGGSAGAAAGASVGSGIDSMFNQQATNKQNAKFAREQMAFQERMSNTAYQRQVKDMEAAGLNPMLAINKAGGASTPSGQTAVMQNANKEMQKGVSTAVDALRVKKEFEQADSNIKLNNAIQDLKQTEAKIASTNAKVAENNLKVQEAQIPAQVQKSLNEYKREKFDSKTMDLDNISRKVNSYGSSAKQIMDIFKPKVNINTNKGSYDKRKHYKVDKNTGELLD